MLFGRLTELWYFFIANLRASIFGVYLLAIFFITEFIKFEHLSRYDLIFIAAVLFQILGLLTRQEKPKEFFIIIIFHILATVMELFKTHDSIGSWLYPDLDNSIFVLATVPLFTGFLYSAVGSYISRAFIHLNLSYTKFPATIHTWVVSTLIYVNFFTHHFIFDIRYFIFLYIFIIFYKTKIIYKVYTKTRSMPFLIAAFLTAFFVWIAENIGTFTNIWLYPNQKEIWQIVSIQKIGSWFLLLVLSFSIVSVIYRDRISTR